MQHLHLYEFGSDAEAKLREELHAQRADILLMQEVDRNKQRSQLADQTSKIADLIGAQDSYFYETVLVPREDGEYGIAIASSIPVKRFVAMDLKPSPVGKRMTFAFDGSPKTSYVHDHPRAAIAAILQNGWCVVNTHLSFMPVAGQWQMLQVVRWARALARQENCKLIIGGDFNFTRVRWLKFFDLKSTVHGLTFPNIDPVQQIDHIMVETSATFSESLVGPLSGLSDHRWIAVTIDVNQ